MQADLALAESQGWTEHFVKQNFDGTWSAIALRGPSGATHPVTMIYADPTCTDFSDTPILARCGYFQSVLARFECPLHAVRLMSLSPGSVIHEHTDYELSVEEGFARIHVPVATNPYVTFLLNGRRVIMEEGECWYLRLTDPHAVRNDGESTRVHLVIDAVANDWLIGLMKDSVAGGR